MASRLQMCSYGCCGRFGRADIHTITI
jgi:hypothetical protein